MPNTSKIAKLKRYTTHHYKVFAQRYFNTTVVEQRKNPKTIPIIINNFNQLFYLKQLIESLQKRGYAYIVILDNNSSYKPLLDYYKSIEEAVKIHRLSSNYGHLSFWKQRELVEKYTKGYYVLTDPDIVPLAECPDDFLKTMVKLLDKAYDRTKVGFSLKLDDIPDSNPQAQTIKNWEAQFWIAKIYPQAYKAEIDTTFALYRPGYTYKKQNFTKAWRTDYPLQAIHGGWYINPANLTDEQIYYQKTANESASWLLKKSGELKSDLHQKTYIDENR
ncbi:glycosyltransferase family 2 protein [Winogradskyella sp.]|nr:glycosyltransferase family 2 protein [Winogradskyella sp.]MDA8874520.1 glycosyltransferase family 2 protein [Winogradskyella sp.]